MVVAVADAAVVVGTAAAAAAVSVRYCVGCASRGSYRISDDHHHNNRSRETVVCDAPMRHTIHFGHALLAAIAAAIRWPFPGPSDQHR